MTNYRFIMAQNNISKKTLMNKVIQITADDLYPSRRYATGIVMLCRGFVDSKGTNQMQQAGLPDLSEFP